MNQLIFKRLSKINGVNKVILFLIFALIQISSFAQIDSLIASGRYYNANVFIYNPDIDNGYSIQAITINGDTLKGNLSTNGIELDFSVLGLNEGSPIQIRIFYKSGAKPTIVNPEVLASNQNLRFSRPKFIKGHLQWRLTGSLSDSPIYIEHFEWGEWRLAGEVDPLDTIRNKLYQYDIPSHSGVNRVRLFTFDGQHKKVESKELRYSVSKDMAVTLATTKIKDDVVFSRETHYELFDNNGILLKSGTDRYVNMRDLPKGLYWLNYDNFTIQIKKK
jgi:hypothetical protein